MPQHIDAALYKRLRPLFVHDIALAAYHLPLDAHPEIGNNALLARALGLDGELERFGERRVRGPVRRRAACPRTSSSRACAR